MPFEEQYRRQVALLLRTIPLVAAEDCFALKGGTAINLFVRDMPRLSVDIDLTYLPVQARDKSLEAIDAAMTRISERVTKAIPGARVNPSRAEGAILKLLLRADGAQIKIEVTPVLRGCVYEPKLRAVSAALEEAFGFAEMQVVSFADLREDCCCVRPAAPARPLRRARPAGQRRHQRRPAPCVYRLPAEPRAAHVRGAGSCSKGGGGHRFDLCQSAGLDVG